MSRRSVLLATTFFIAVSSLATAGPASAHGFGFGGFGGFGGHASFASRLPVGAYAPRAAMPSLSNFDGGRFGHAPSVGTPAAMGSGAAVVPVVRPAQVPPAISSGNTSLHPSIDAASGTRPSDSLPNQVKTVNPADGRGRLPNPGSTGQRPDMAGADAMVIALGHPDNGHGPSVPGVKPQDGPNLNLPGSLPGQKGPRDVPGFGDGSGGASRLNTPGSMQQHDANDAVKKLTELEKSDQQLLQAAGKGGANSLNTSTGLAPGERESDKYGAETGSGAAGQNFVNTGRPVDPLVNTGRPVTVWSSKGSDGNGGTMYLETVSGPGVDRSTIVHTAKDGTVTIQRTVCDPNTGSVISRTTTTTSGDGKNNTPNDDSTNSHDIGSLAAGSSLGRLGQGGGTDNNGTESAGRQSSQLAPGATSGRTGQGDGNDGRGDNNRVSTDGTLAAGSSLARKDQGDGGGSDTREGATTMGGIHVQPGGGNPNQSNLKAAAAATN